jgi:hypothetical protein
MLDLTDRFPLYLMVILPFDGFGKISNIESLSLIDATDVDMQKEVESNKFKDGIKSNVGSTLQTSWSTSTTRFVVFDGLVFNNIAQFN